MIVEVLARMNAVARMIAVDLQALKGVEPQRTR
jgi:hypothetical protein